MCVPVGVESRGVGPFLAALRYTGAAMESSVELLPSKDIMVREERD